MKPEVSKHPLTSIWYFTPTVVIGGGVGWAGSQPEAEQQLGGVAVGEQRQGERSTSPPWLPATVMALYRD